MAYDNVTITTTEYKELIKKATMLDIIAVNAATDKYISTSFVEQLLKQRPTDAPAQAVAEPEKKDEPDF